MSLMLLRVLRRPADGLVALMHWSLRLSYERATHSRRPTLNEYLHAIVDVALKDEICLLSIVAGV